MTGVVLTIDTLGMREAEKALARLLARLGDLKPLMEIFGAYFTDETRHRFELGETPEGEKWKPSLRAVLFGGKTLLDRGLLRDSYVHKAGSDQAEIGSGDIRARIHHFGGIIKATVGALVFRLAGGGFRSVRQVVMPARPALGVNAADEREVQELTREYAERALA